MNLQKANRNTMLSFPNFRCSQLSLFHSAPPFDIWTGYRAQLLCRPSIQTYENKSTTNFTVQEGLPKFCCSAFFILQILLHCRFSRFPWQVLKISLGAVLQEMGQANEALQLLSSAGGAVSSRALAFLQKGRNSATETAMKHVIA